MFGYWVGVPRSLEPFYRAAYLREAWLRSTLVPAVPGTAIAKATRMGALTPQIIWAEGPSVSTFNAIIGVIGQGMVIPHGGGSDQARLAQATQEAVAEGFSMPRFVKSYEGGASLSDALARGIGDSSVYSKGGVPWSEVLPDQRAIEYSVAEEGPRLRQLPVAMWPRYPREQCETLGALGIKSEDAKAATLAGFLRDQGVSRGLAFALATGEKPKLKDLSPVVAGEGNPGVWGSGDQMRIANELAPMVADLDGFPTREGRAYALRTHAQNSAPANLFIQTFIYGGDQAMRIAQTRAVYIDTAQTQLLPLDFGNPGSGWMLLASRVDPGPWKEPSS